MNNTLTSHKPAENNATAHAKKRFEEALLMLEMVLEEQTKRQDHLQKACHRTSEELGLHIRNLGRIIERQES